MINEIVPALAIGLLVFGAVYLALDLVFPGGDRSVRKAKAIFAGAGYLLVTWSLWKDPTLLDEVSAQFVGLLIGVVVALLLALRTALRRR
jgi:hypothetical protein